MSLVIYIEVFFSGIKYKQNIQDIVYLGLLGRDMPRHVSGVIFAIADN